MHVDNALDDRQAEAGRTFSRRGFCREPLEASEQPLLSSWGRVGREFLEQVFSYEEVQPASEEVVLREPSRVVVVNRTASRAVELVAPYRADCAIAALTAAELQAEAMRFDIVINATSSSLSDALPLPSNADIFYGDALAYDMMYGKQLTPFEFVLIFFSACAVARWTRRA